MDLSKAGTNSRTPRCIGNVVANPILSITMKDAHEAIVHAARITDSLWIIQFVLPGIGDVNLYFRSAEDATDLLARAFRTLISTKRKNYEAYYEYETP